MENGLPLLSEVLWEESGRNAHENIVRRFAVPAFHPLMGKIADLIG